MEYSVIIYHDPADGMYIGQCKEYPEAFSQGATLDEFIANMKESIELAVKSRVPWDMQATWHSVLRQKLTLCI